MSVNSNEMSMILKGLKNPQKKTRKLLPKFSKAFPKDFFYEQQEKPSSPDFNREITERKNTNRSIMSGIENILTNSHSTHSLRSEIYIKPNYVRKSVDSIPNNIVHKRHMSSHVISTKNVDLTERSVSKQKNIPDLPKPNQESQVLTFREQENTPFEFKRTKEKNFYDKYHNEDKENIMPNILIPKPAKQKIKTEPNDPGTPIFKSQASKAELYCDMQPRRIDTFVEQFEFANFNQEVRSIPTYQINIRGSRRYRSGRTSLNLNPSTSIKNLRDIETDQSVISSVNYSRGFLPSIFKF